jgi:hypothetical protein
MLRRYELIDMVVAIGFCATIAATDWQANLDRAIVVATQTSTITSSLAGDRLGEAIMQLTAFQSAYDAAHAAMQEHLVAATVAAIRLNLQTSDAGPKHFW